MQVVQYNHHPQERRPHDLSWVDTSVKAELNRISVKLSAAFLANMLVSHFMLFIRIQITNVDGSAINASLVTMPLPAFPILCEENGRVWKLECHEPHRQTLDKLHTS